MRPAEEADHLRSAYRQLDAAGRRGLVVEMLDRALARLDAADLQCDFDAVVVLCLGTRADPDPVRAAVARVARSCVQWLEAEPTDAVFFEIAASYAMTDPVHKLRVGRPRGAIGLKMAYAQDLVATHGQRVSAKVLHGVALGAADQPGSPFGREDGELWDKSKDCAYPLREFEKLISSAKNPKMR